MEKKCISSKNVLIQVSHIEELVIKEKYDFAVSKISIQNISQILNTSVSIIEWLRSLVHSLL